MIIEGKGLGGKRINRVNISLSNKNSLKLNRLATACNLKPTTLAGLFIEKCLDNPQLVAEMQKEYCTQSAYRVLLINKGGELHYVLNDNMREDLK
jgi:hypothetical protein